MDRSNTITATVASATLSLLAYVTPWLLAVWVGGAPADGYSLGGDDEERRVVWLPAPAPHLELEEPDEADEPPEPKAAPETAAETAAVVPEVLAAPIGTPIAAVVPETATPAAINPKLKHRAAMRRVGSERKKARRKHCTKEWSEIRPRDDGVVEVDLELIEHYTDNLETFMKLGWSKPYETENGTRGWYVSGFGCNSPLHAGGLRRGDVLLNVNGKKTRTWVQVFFLYQKLKHKRDFDVALLRKGEPVTLHFEVIEPPSPERRAKRNKGAKRKKRRKER